MTMRDFRKARARDLVARRGADDITDMNVPGGLTPPRPRPSKAEDRALIEQSVAPVTRLIVCKCGRRATVKIPAERVGLVSLVCSKCGAKSKA